MQRDYYTIPSLVAGSVIIVVSLLAFIAFVPASSDKLMPVLLGLLVPLLGFIIKQLNDAQVTRLDAKATVEATKAVVEDTKAAVQEVHSLTNSRMTEMQENIKQTAETARVLAAENTERRVDAAHAEGVLEGRIDSPPAG